VKPTFAALLSSALLASCASGQGKTPVPDLLKTEWLLEDLGGKGVLDRAQATLAFPEEKKVAGNGSCNRFFGPAQLTGDKISLGPLASTRMACRSAALINQESNYLDALKNAEHFSVDGPYLLIYAKGFDKPLRFTQIRPKNQP